ncbi:hypothetical protein SSP24_11030 [Streptomyces spinoverrucosus]|uniref:HTH arsR-type domain-containing protein n=1 Tax=Streptomyces spinoverrucosus TaxID=284043 RepID=A0A4Y3VBH5_9ACTN|nr:metalloregulator ArsR/SmtB family transcription factor [Streptomyces spinoverrucosus]GEC03448.1 hypothetical protein SSP24_11030 [Streptomyces spinoverrucosus]GHB35570.1 hypothetical protein GCM10010397_01540 [Streptomyces spinoverrucosus]
MWTVVTRLMLLEFILRRERTSAECVEHAGISQPRGSVHLPCLVDCGHVTARRDGRKLRYSVGDPRVADLVVLAPALAADNAAALDCCPPHPREAAVAMMRPHCPPPTLPYVRRDTRRAGAAPARHGSDT